MTDMFGEDLAANRVHELFIDTADGRGLSLDEICEGLAKNVIVYENLLQNRENGIFIPQDGDREALYIPGDNVAGLVETVYDSGPSADGAIKHEYFPELRVYLKYAVDGETCITLRDADAEDFLDRYAGRPSSVW